MPADVKASQSSGGDVRPGERDKALNLVLGQIERNFGKGSIMRLGTHPGCGWKQFPLEP